MLKHEGKEFTQVEDFKSECGIKKKEEGNNVDNARQFWDNLMEKCEKVSF